MQVGLHFELEYISDNKFTKDQLSGISEISFYIEAYSFLPLDRLEHCLQWTLVNPDRVNSKPRKSEVQSQIKFGVKVMVCKCDGINKVLRDSLGPGSSVVCSVNVQQRQGSQEPKTEWR